MLQGDNSAKQKDAVIPRLQLGFVDQKEFVIKLQSSASNEAGALLRQKGEPQKQEGDHLSTSLLASSSCGRSLQSVDNDVRLSMCCFMTRAQQLQRLMMSNCEVNEAKSLALFISQLSLLFESRHTICSSFTHTCRQPTTSKFNCRTKVCTAAIAL